MKSARIAALEIEEPEGLLARTQVCGEQRRKSMKSAKATSARSSGEQLAKHCSHAPRCAANRGANEERQGQQRSK